MNVEGEHGILFLTAPPEVGAKIAEAVKVQFSSIRWTVYLRENDLGQLREAVGGMEIASDKPSGSKAAFLAEIRRRRYDVAVVAWTGHRSYNRMKTVGLLSAAKRHLIYNENLDYFYLDGNDGTWLRHLRWRASGGVAFSPSIINTVIGIYKWTIGIAIGSTWLISRLVYRRLRIRLTAARAS